MIQVKDIQRTWQCDFCRYWIEAESEPRRCPNCGQHDRGFSRLATIDQEKEEA